MCADSSYLECKCSPPHQPVGVVHGNEVFEQFLSKKLLDRCGRSNPNKPPSSGQNSGSFSWILPSWMMECKGKHPHHQHRHPSMMKTVPPLFHLWVSDLCQWIEIITTLSCTHKPHMIILILGMRWHTSLQAEYIKEWTWLLGYADSEVIPLPYKTVDFLGIR